MPKLPGSSAYHNANKKLEFIDPEKTEMALVTMVSRLDSRVRYLESVIQAVLAIKIQENQ